MTKQKEPSPPKIEDLPRGVTELTHEEASRVEGGLARQTVKKTANGNTTLSSGGPQDVGDRPDET